MSKYQISAPVFNAVLTGRKKEIKDAELDDLYGEVLEKFDEIGGLKGSTAGRDTFSFETDDLEEAKEIKEKLQKVVNQLTAEFPEAPDWIKDCVKIDTQPD